MTRGIRLTATAVLAAIGVGLAAPHAAEAGSKGRRNTAIGLGAVAVYGIVKKKPVIAGLAGGGAIYSYVRSRQAAKKERARRQARQRARYRRVNYYRNGRRYTRYVRYR